MDSEQLWRMVLGELELTLSRGHFITWFKNTNLIDTTNDIYTISVPNVFIKEQLESRYQDLVFSLIQKSGHSPVRVVFVIGSGEKIKKAPRTEQTVSPTNELIKRPAAPQKTGNQLSHSYRQGLNERYTFDNFIVGSGNELAHAACQAVAHTPGKKYNPLFLYGGVGIGKTHLIQAVGNEIIKNNPRARVVYVSSEQFVQEFIDAVRYKKNTDFASYYRNADVLIIDDMQFIAGKDKTQEEFFHTFNALHQANKQIIISSDKPPKDIPTLEERLRSRFAWGMSIDMQNPDFETRCAIVQSKAEVANIQLPNDVVEFLANHIQTNIRELEGALNQLVAFCEMRRVEPSVEYVADLLSSHIQKNKRLNAKQIIDKVAKHYQVSVSDLLSPKRDKDIVFPRQIAMYLMRSELDLSFPKIARELGRKDHTTAMHSISKMTSELKTNIETKQVVQELKEKLYV
jgi:chromosomal replication initiator protein